MSSAFLTSRFKLFSLLSFFLFDVFLACITLTNVYLVVCSWAKRISLKYTETDMIPANSCDLWGYKRLENCSGTRTRAPPSWR